jgi:hypothetical protein
MIYLHGCNPFYAHDYELNFIGSLCDSLAFLSDVYRSVHDEIISDVNEISHVSMNVHCFTLPYD